MGPDVGQPTPEEAAYAHFDRTKLMAGIAAEKAAGDAHGIAARQLAELISVSEQIAAERRA